VNRVWQCMTSASELFHIRRHRLGRNDIDSSFHSSPSPDFHHHHRLHDSDDDDSPRIRRHYNVRRLRHHVPSYFPTHMFNSNPIFHHFLLFIQIDNCEVLAYNYFITVQFLIELVEKYND